MVVNRTDSRRWVDVGTRLVARELAGLDEEAFAQPSGLPGWSRKHVAAHLAVNADALSNLVSWAATGVESRMYAAPEYRNLEIEAGATRHGEDLRAWFDRATAALDEAMDALTHKQWHARVVSLQGREATAVQIPWVRAREVLVHAADLGTGVRFADLPRDFLGALCDDIVVRRAAVAGHPAVRLVAVDVDSGRWGIADRPAGGAPTPVPTVSGPLAELAAYLSGRPHEGLVTSDGERVPSLPPWL